MISPFGVEHCVVYKADRANRAAEAFDIVVDDNGEMSDKVTPLASGTTVDVYNRTAKRRRSATIANWTAKGTGAAVGGVAGALLYGKTHGVVPKNGIKLVGRNMSKDKAEGIALSAATGTGSTILGYAGGRAHQEYVKRNPKYGYKEK